MQTDTFTPPKNEAVWNPPRCGYCGYPLKKKLVAVSRVQKRAILVEADTGLTHLCGDR
jgi:hypothetical protein